MNLYRLLGVVFLKGPKIRPDELVIVLSELYRHSWSKDRKAFIQLDDFVAIQPQQTGHDQFRRVRDVQGL